MVSCRFCSLPKIVLRIFRVGSCWGAQEEAAAITGTSDPEAAAHAILDRPGAVTQWCVVKLGSRGAVLCSKSLSATYRQHALMVPRQPLPQAVAQLHLHSLWGTLHASYLI